MKLALIEKFYCSSIPSLEFLVLSDGDPWNSNIARVSTLWWVVDFYTWQKGFLCSKQTPNLPNPEKHGFLCSKQTPNLPNPKKRKIENRLLGQY